MHKPFYFSTNVSTATDDTVKDTAIGDRKRYISAEDGREGTSLTLFKAGLPHNTYYGMYHNMVVQVLLIYNRLQEEW